MELLTNLWYKNLVARTDADKRIFVQPPPDLGAAARPELTELLIVPNYEAPFEPTLLCTHDGLTTLSFTPFRSPTQWQLRACEGFLSTSGGSDSGSLLFQSPNAGAQITCKLVWVIECLVRDLTILTNRALLVARLERMQAEMNDDVVGAVWSHRLDPLDMGKIAAIKWAKLVHKDDAEEQLREAKRLYERVDLAYAQMYEGEQREVRRATTNTLHNILVDYHHIITV
jgi:hypothetical protein